MFGGHSSQPDEACTPCSENGPLTKDPLSLLWLQKGTATEDEGPTPTTSGWGPLERVAMDILGPLPPTRQGNRYILVIMDYFTKWPEAFALPNQEAEVVARAFVEGFACRYGIPQELHTDQGRNFESRLLKEVCRLLEIRKTRTTPLRPQSDGMVERFIKIFLSTLIEFCLLLVWSTTIFNEANVGAIFFCVGTHIYVNVCAQILIHIHCFVAPGYNDMQSKHKM